MIGRLNEIRNAMGRASLAAELAVTKATLALARKRADFLAVAVEETTKRAKETKEALDKATKEGLESAAAIVALERCVAGLLEKSRPYEDEIARLRKANEALREERDTARKLGRELVEEKARTGFAVVARDDAAYTARTKRAVNSLTVERGPKGGAA